MDLANKRTSKNLPQNTFQKGDLVLLRLSRDKPKPHKLHPKYLGPYEVLQHVKNDVEVRHMATNKISTVYVGDLKAFYGSASDAKQLASVDADQYLIDVVSAYRGDPLQRSEMYFYVEYTDGDKLWIPWSLDLQSSEAYHNFCSSLTELYPLLLPSASLPQWMRDLRKKPITHVKPNQQVLINLRAFGADWYSSLSLPEKDFTCYLAPSRYGSLSAKNKLISLACPLLGITLSVDNLLIALYGNNALPDTPHTVVSSDLVSAHPCLLTHSTPQGHSVTDYQYLVGLEFYDKEARSTFVVTRIHITRQRDIVAFVQKRKPDGSLQREDPRPYHVADVINLVHTST